jgi:hypothetical protein
MKKTLLWLGALLILVIALPAPSASAAPRGGFRGGFHGGGRVIIHGGFGPFWGWGYPYYGYGYYGPYNGYGAGSEANWGAVKTDVEPEEARVYLDGQYIGTADDFDGWPDKLYLRPGNYKLEFRLNGYEPVVLNVRARAGTTLEVDNHLRKAPGLSQKADPPKIEGDVQRFFGKRRDGDSARPYTRDRNRIERDRSDDESYSDSGSDDRPQADARDRDRDDDRDAPPARSDDSWRGNRSRRPADSSVTARPVRGDRSRITIHAEPADAAVYVDDRFVGTADELASMEHGIVVSPGKHTVTVSRPGYRDRTTDVQVDAGHTEAVNLKLAR